MRIYKAIIKLALLATLLLAPCSILFSQRLFPQRDFTYVDSLNTGKAKANIPAADTTHIKQGYTFISHADGNYWQENLKQYILDSIQLDIDTIATSNITTIHGDTICTIVELDTTCLILSDSVYFEGDSIICIIEDGDTSCIALGTVAGGIHGIYDGSGTVPSHVHAMILDDLKFDNGTLFIRHTISGGRVGIGTITPFAGYKLHVAGPILSVQGTSNTFLSGGNTTLTGQGNTVAGANGGLFLTTGTYNTLLGLESGQALTTGVRNLAAGSFPAHAMTTGFDNVALGHRALYTMTTNSANVAIGSFAGESTNGTQNVFIGYQSGQNNVGYGNIMIGAGAGQNVTASNMMRIDNSNDAAAFFSGDMLADTFRLNASLRIRDALRDRTGSAGTASYILKSTGSQIEWINPSSITGMNGIYGGNGTTPANVQVTMTDSITFDARTLSIDGTNNRVGINIKPAYPFDFRGLGRIADVNSNTVLSGITATSVSGSKNVFIGIGAGNNAAASTVDSSNVAIGYDALRLNATKGGNVAIGKDAARSRQNATAGVFIGLGAGDLPASGSGEIGPVMIGRYAGRNMQGTNTVIGYLSGRNTSNTFNTGVTILGASTAGSGSSNIGDYNTLIGSGIGTALTGEGNTVVGYTSASALTTGEYNVVIGTAAGQDLTSGSINTFIGAGAGAGITTQTGVLSIEQSNSNYTLGLISGSFAVDTLHVHGKFRAYIDRHQWAVSAFASETLTDNSPNGLAMTATGAKTAALPDASSTTMGYWFQIQNASGSGAITVSAPGSGDTINGILTINPGESAIWECGYGSAWLHN
ncbi:MAG TPA: hypothetical protein VFG10_18975 [Saprospiraceae bacterium]|nr:hypothetical protein [Saprospiraceae bacterium]